VDEPGRTAQSAAKVQPPGKGLRPGHAICERESFRR
jgi:hypothetical protein